MREVATSADLSVGAVMYHFPTTEDLLLAVHTDVQVRYLQSRKAAADSRGDAWSRLLNVFKAGLPPFAEREMIELLYEMHGLTRRSPRHAVLLTELWKEELALCCQIVSDGSSEGVFFVDDEKRVAQALLALEDGLALHLVSNNSALDSGAALRAYTASAAAILGRVRPA
ncbi:MAG: TetR family transcriptional regulator C-terminal domain-containing protein [Brevibacterium sp.]|nr:TetR family transcriptional regulator C-terminal domain-containing protein [Brevibacterium sp.]